MKPNLTTIGVFSLFFLPCSCAEEQKQEKPPAPRAVTAITQAVRSPARKLRIAGVAAAWKQEKLSFQVGGRITWVIEPERTVNGPTIDANFHPGRDGTVIARIDPERYDSALAAAKASLAARQATLKATRKQLESVLPQDLARAEAELKRAKENRDRMQRAVARNAVAATELTNAQAAFETARAVVDSVQGRIASMRADLEGLTAQVSQAEQNVKNAEYDVRDTELRAPFDGVVTQVSVVPGALVQPGTPVAELVMMDPIKIELTVSTKTEREIGNQDRGLAFPRGSKEPIIASLYQRDSVADPATRTVRVTLICRNPEETMTPVGATVIEDVMPLIQFPVENRRSWFIERRCVKTDSNGTFAWRVKPTESLQVTGELLELERMPITLANARKDFVGLYQFQEIVPPSSLEPILATAPGITVRKVLFGMSVPDGFRGGKAAVVRRSWTMRPGDVVDVQLDLLAPEPGIYVPASAIAHEGEQAFVYLVKGDTGSTSLERLNVVLGARVGTEIRIAGERLGAGEPIVDTGTHILRDGEAVQVTAVRSLQ